MYLKYLQDHKIAFFSNLENPLAVDRNFRESVRSPGDSSQFKCNFQNSIHKISEDIDYNTFDSIVKFTRVIDEAFGFEKKKTIIRKNIKLDNFYQSTNKSSVIRMFNEYYSLLVDKSSRNINFVKKERIRKYTKCLGYN
jgi:hypothetical protein